MHRLLVVALLACGGGVEPEMVHYTAQTLKGVACRDFAEAVCAKFVACGQTLLSNQRACVLSIEATCCSDERCGGPVGQPAGAADCVNGIPGENCLVVNAVVKSVPNYCRKVF